MKLNTDIINKAKNIKLVVLDVDGVLTSGQLYYNADGEQQKVFHVHDGLGIQLLLQSGIEVAVISGRDSVAVENRLRTLGVKHIFQGHSEKLTVFLQLLTQLRITAEQTACVGDDWPDLALLHRAGLSIAVANAVPAVKEIADCISELKGGSGAVREICEFILQSQEKLKAILARYLN